MLSETKTKRPALDFKNLPDEAIAELKHFYEYLLHKYTGRKKTALKKDIVKNVEKLSWSMGAKLYKHRDELHER